jgi:hypothetical protein
VPKLTYSYVEFQNISRGTPDPYFKSRRVKMRRGDIREGIGGEGRNRREGEERDEGPLLPKCIPTCILG